MAGTGAAPLVGMPRISLVGSVVLTLVAILIVSFVGKAFGFHVSVLGSLVLSIGLTLIVNVLLAAFRRRERAA
jgi:hypothetical protein